jgi:heptosyltransferase II
MVQGIDELVELPSGGPLAARTSGEARVIASGQFDVAILLTNSFGSAWTMWRAGLPERWGYRRNLRRWLLTRAVPIPRTTPAEPSHHGEYYQTLVRALGIEPLPLRPQLVVPGRERLRAQALLEAHGSPPGATLIGFAPGAAYGPAKRWPPERYGELIARLVEDPAITCVLVGSPADADEGRAIESSLRQRDRLQAEPGGAPGPRLANLIGQTDLPALAGVLAACRLLVSNDSGAMHLAAAVGVPVVAIFGPTDEQATGPLGERHRILSHPVGCRPCLLRECPIDHRCMTRIPISDVFDAIVARLGRPLAARRTG